MSATATKSATKTEMKTRTKARKTSVAKVEANRRNSQKSSGPKSDAGKARSRYNALKHGMTAKTVLLPGDDPEEFAGRLRYLQDDLQARNSLEAVVIERLAGDLWKSDRSDQSFCTRIKFRLRHGPVDRRSRMRTRPSSWASICSGCRSFRCRWGARGRGERGLGQIPVCRRARRSSSSGQAALEAASDGRRLRLAAHALG